MPPPASRWASTLASSGRAGGPGGRGQPGHVAGVGRRVAADAALAPDHQVGPGPGGQGAAEPLAGPEPVLDRADHPRLDVGHPDRPGRRRRRPQRPEGQRGQGEGDRGRGRRRPGRARDPRGRAAAATATLTATSRKLTPQTPPRAATDSSAGAFHWLAPSRPQGPPSPSQERTASPATNALGTSTRAAASRAGPGRPAAAEQRPGQPAQRQPESRPGAWPAAP